MGIDVVLARSEHTARALRRHVELLAPQPSNDIIEIIIESELENGSEVVRLFKDICSKLNISFSNFSATDARCFCDSLNFSSLNAIEEAGGWESLVSMLVLSYPEVFWHFGVCRVQGTTSGLIDLGSHMLVTSLNREQREPLFDPTGLRDEIRRQTNTAMASSGGGEIAVRTKMAAAIEEEIPYAYFHAYTAYRFGARADVVSSWTMMRRLFGGASLPHPYWLLIEDMSLKFADRRSGDDFRDLGRRGVLLPKLDSARFDLETSNYRVLITTGSPLQSDPVLENNRNYLKGKVIRDPGRTGILFKPMKGVFDLWSGITGRPTDRLENAPGFHWPPPAEEVSAGSNRDPMLLHHGAPGRLVVVSRQLLERAGALLNGPITVERAILGAVFSGDALELVSGRTPTTALEALTLKHEFETLAECKCAGIQHHISIEPRLNAIESETKAIAAWYTSDKRGSVEQNAELNIISTLINVLRNYNKIEEDRYCVGRARRLHNTIWMKKNMLNMLAWPVLAYLEVLLESFSFFVTAIGAWIIGLFLLYALFSHPGCAVPQGVLIDAVSSFFSAGGAIAHPAGPAGDACREPTWGTALVTCLAIGSGAFHLGVFISHLYTVVSRK